MRVDWNAVRAAYTTTSEPVAAIARRFHCSASSIFKKAREGEWVRVPAEVEEHIGDKPSSELIGQKCQPNVNFILAKIGSGWTPQRAFAACGFSKKEMEAWLKEDPTLFMLTSSLRQATLGAIEAALFARATNGSHEAALKYLSSAPEAREQYEATAKSGGPKVEIKVQIGADNVVWDRDTAPKVIEHETQD